MIKAFRYFPHLYVPIQFVPFLPTDQLKCAFSECLPSHAKMDTVLSIAFKIAFPMRQAQLHAHMAQMMTRHTNVLCKISVSPHGA